MIIYFIRKKKSFSSYAIYFFFLSMKGSSSESQFSIIFLRIVGRFLVILIFTTSV